MIYAIVLGDLPAQQISKQPDSVQRVMETALNRLAERPSRFTVPSSGQKNGQGAEIPVDQGGTSLWVVVLFRYGQDETTLHIESIRVEFGG